MATGRQPARGLDSGVSDWSSSPFGLFSIFSPFKAQGYKVNTATWPQHLACSMGVGPGGSLGSHPEMGPGRCRQRGSNDRLSPCDSLKCRRCVVVGNGSRLRNSSLGDTIDKYDVVIRCVRLASAVPVTALAESPGGSSDGIFLSTRLNNAPVAGYEDDVGSKTTMRLFYPESAHFDPKVQNNPDTLLVLVAFKAMDFHWIETILSDKKRVGGKVGEVTRSGRKDPVESGPQTPQCVPAVL